MTHHPPMCEFCWKDAVVSVVLEDGLDLECCDDCVGEVVMDQGSKVDRIIDHATGEEVHLRA